MFYLWLEEWPVRSGILSSFIPHPWDICAVACLRNPIIPHVKVKLSLCLTTSN
jgi:hypothetical protein